MKNKEIKVVNILLYEKIKNIKNGFYHLNQIVFAYNSNHIEGSRLNKEQTKHIYETNSFYAHKDGEKIRLDDILETKNHFRAFDFILENYNATLNEIFIKELHKILKQETTESIVGEYKKLQNYIGDLKTTSPKQVSQKMETLLDNYNNKKNITIDDIVDFHFNFESIHPFSDGNGRVGRLIMFKECLKNNIMPFIIDDEHKAFYYRGLKNYVSQKGFLVDTCLSCQDDYENTFNDYLNNSNFDLESAYSLLEKIMSDFPKTNIENNLARLDKALIEQEQSHADYKEKMSKIYDEIHGRKSNVATTNDKEYLAEREAVKKTMDKMEKELDKSAINAVFQRLKDK